MLLQDFSGGLNTRVAPSLINKNESQTFTNIDATSGSIKPINGSILHLPNVNKYFTYYYTKGEFFSKATESSFVEYRDILYLTNYNSYPTKYDGTNEYRLGITAPMPTTYTLTLDTGVLTGTYNYCYTYYNSTDDTESQPSPISQDIVASSNSIHISMSNPSSDPQVTQIRLYRSGGSLSQFTLVDTVSNSAVNYTDNKADIDIAGNHILASFNYTEAPNNLKYITEAYGMLFGAVKDKLYYSNIGEPNYWPATNFIDFNANITGIGAVQNGLLVFTSLETYLITGNSPTTFSKYLLDASQGCINPYSIGFVKGAILWLSNDGICTTSGGGVKVITRDKLGKLSLNNTQNAVVYDNVYYLLHNDGILVVDFRFNLAVRTLDIKPNRLGAYLDRFFIQQDTNLYELFKGDALPYTYKSGMLTEGQYTNYKVYKDFYIKYKGDITIKIYIDKNLMTSVSLTGDKCYNLKAPTNTKGYGLEFEITGTGEVSEIQYTVLPRQNGK